LTLFPELNGTGISRAIQVKCDKGNREKCFEIKLMRV